jgi:hypothetical protein
VPTTILDGLSLVDTTGRSILAATVATLLAALGAHLFLRARYRALERDLVDHGDPSGTFSSPVLRRIVRDAEAAARRSTDPGFQAIIEDDFQAELGAPLLAERFLRAATGLVLILGLLGTFYGLTLSIGKLVHLLAADSGAGADISQAITLGLTNALSGMAIAFSNSLLGVLSAVVLTVLSVLHNVTDRRTALMLRVETYVEGLLSRPGGTDGAAIPVADFGAAVHRLEAVVARFEASLLRFAASTNDLREMHLVIALKPGDRG